MFDTEALPCIIFINLFISVPFSLRLRLCFAIIADPAYGVYGGNFIFPAAVRNCNWNSYAASTHSCRHTHNHTRKRTHARTHAAFYQIKVGNTHSTSDTNPEFTASFDEGTRQYFFRTFVFQMLGQLSSNTSFSIMTYVTAHCAFVIN